MGGAGDRSNQLINVVILDCALYNFFARVRLTFECCTLKQAGLIATNYIDLLLDLHERFVN